MSNTALNWAIKQVIGDPVAKCVLVCLANRLNGKTGRLDPSIEQICQDTGACRRTVLAKLQWLIDAGFLAKKRRRRGTNCYVLKSRSETSKDDVEKCKPCTSKTAENANQEVQTTSLRSANFVVKKCKPCTLILKPEGTGIEPEGNGTGFSNQVPVAESESRPDIFSPSAAAAPSIASRQDGSRLPEGALEEIRLRALWQEIYRQLPPQLRQQIQQLHIIAGHQFRQLRSEAVATGNAQAGVSVLAQWQQEGRQRHDQQAQS